LAYENIFETYNTGQDAVETRRGFEMLLLVADRKFEISEIDKKSKPLTV
jgi:hypothetical protein